MTRESIGHAVMTYLAWDECLARVLVCRLQECSRMNIRRFFHLSPAVSIALALISAGALAQSPATPPAPGTVAPETPAPAPSAPATPAPAAPVPATPPPAAEAPVAPPPAAAPLHTADPFGEEITLTPKTAVVLKGSANWDSAFET